MMEHDLNKLFAQLSYGREYNVYISRYANRAEHEQWEISISTDKSGASITVSGKGSDFRVALGDAYARLEALLDALSDKPQPPVDDDIPF